MMKKNCTYTIVIKDNKFAQIEEKVTNGHRILINSVTSYVDNEATQALRGMAGGGYVREIRKKLYRPKTQRFPHGLVKRVKKVLEKHGHTVEIKDSRKKLALPEEEVRRRFKNLPVKLRGYQKRAVIKSMTQSGLIEVATGGGKTIILAATIAISRVPSLILTHRVELMAQLRDSIAWITGEEVGVIGDGVWEPKNITVGLVASLNAASFSLDMFGVSKETKLKKFFEGIKYLVIDEAHHAAARSWAKVIKACKNTELRHGLSATMFRTDNADLLLNAHIGETIFRRGTSYLIRKGYLAKPDIEIALVNWRGSDLPNHWQTVEKNMIVENDERNKIGCKFIYNHYAEGRQILGIVRLIKHGNALRDMLVEKFGVEPKDVKFVHGSTSKAVREKTLEDFKNGLFPILLGSSIYDEGVDIPAIDAACNFAAGISEIKVRQRIGRILRKKKDEKGDIDKSTEQIVYYMDFFDKGHKFVRRHSRLRLEVYLSEPEFRLHGYLGIKGVKGIAK